MIKKSRINSMENQAKPSRFSQMQAQITDLIKGHYLYVNGDYLPLRYVFNDLMKAHKVPASGYETEFIAALAASGVLPFTDGFNLVPKLHVERCIMLLKKEDPIIWLQTVRDKEHRYLIDTGLVKGVLKKVLRHVREKPNQKFLIRFNKNTKEIFDFARKQHYSFWITTHLEKALTELSKPEWVQAHPNFQGLISELCLYDESTGKTMILSVDIGYRAGAVYTSMSGATNSSFNGIGTLHLIMLKELLVEYGFKCWDLGMEMDYKLELGAAMIPRKAFLNVVNFSQNIQTVFSDKDVDITQHPSFMRLVEFMTNHKAQSTEGLKNIKLSRRLNVQMKQTENNIPPKNWSPEYLQQWVSIKGPSNVEPMYFSQLINATAVQLNISKKKCKKIKKLLNKLVSKPKFVDQASIQTNQ